MRSGLGLLSDSLVDTKVMIDQEIYTQHQYTFMMARMKKDFINLKLKSSAFDGALYNKATVLDLEQ